MTDESIQREIRFFECRANERRKKMVKSWRINVVIAAFIMFLKERSEIDAKEWGGIEKKSENQEDMKPMQLN